jgi:DnaJ-class molecular chaperone
VSANGALHASNTTKPVARREGAGVGVAVAALSLALTAVNLGGLRAEEHRTKEAVKNCEGKGTLKKEDKIVRCRRCGGTGIKP